jgi:hypothetical protein
LIETQPTAREGCCANEALLEVFVFLRFVFSDGCHVFAVDGCAEVCDADIEPAGSSGIRIGRDGSRMEIECVWIGLFWIECVSIEHVRIERAWIERQPSRCSR